LYLQTPEEFREVFLERPLVKLTGLGFRQKGSNEQAPLRMTVMIIGAEIDRAFRGC
jgi:hypothetical protein